MPGAPVRAATASTAGGAVSPVRGEVRQPLLRGVERAGVIGDEIVADTAGRRVHAGATHLFEGRVLADDLFGHARRAEVHGRVALDHEHDVTERRDVGAAGRRRTEQAAHLRHATREAHLVGEDASRAPPSREQLDLIGDARPGRVDEVDDRNLVTERGLGQAHDLLDRARTP